MKILTFVDIHGSLKAMEKIEEKSKKVDILVCAGDISIFEQDLEYLLKRLDKIGKPVLVIPGNHETEHVMEKFCSKFKNLHYIHKKVYKTGNYRFLGYGGGGFSTVDPEFEKVAKMFEREIEKHHKVILVTHAPPHKTNVDKIGKEYHGNKTIRQFIEKIDIDLAVCGHLHETSGKEDIVKKTRVINPGPYGKIIEL
jgi:Icc-related predicted phosphoesterase